MALVLPGRTPFLILKGEESYLGVRLGAVKCLYGHLLLWVEMTDSVLPL